MRFQVGVETFILKSKVLADSGFLEIMPWQGQVDKKIPVYRVGQMVDIKEIRITEGKVITQSYSNYGYRPQPLAT